MNKELENLVRKIDGTQTAEDEVDDLVNKMGMIQAYADEVKVEFANDVMNKAYRKNGIKGIPHSNKIAEFIKENLNK